MSGRSKNIEQFGDLFDRKAKGHVKVQTYWAVVKEVDWEDKTMTAVGIDDNLDFWDVLLGLGFCYCRPKVGTKCLIGVLENNDAATFLIAAEALEEAIYTSGESQFIIKETGFIVKANGESLKKIINDQNEQLGKLCDEIMKIVVAIGTSPNNPMIALIKKALSETNDKRFNKILIE